MGTEIIRTKKYGNWKQFRSEKGKMGTEQMGTEKIGTEKEGKLKATW